MTLRVVTLRFPMYLHKGFLARFLMVSRMLHVPHKCEPMYLSRDTVLASTVPLR